MKAQRVAATLFCVILYPAVPAMAQQRFTAQADLSRSSVNAFGETFTQRWSGWQIEYEQRFLNDKLWGVLSGFAVGVRHEQEHISYRGTYIIARGFKAIDAGAFTILIGGGAVYGLAGNLLNDVRQEHTGREQLGYVQVFQVQNVNIPWYPTENAGVLYPEFSLGVRHDLFNHIGIEPFVGVRILTMHTKSENFRNGTTLARNIKNFVPTTGIRLSYRF